MPRTKDVEHGFASCDEIIRDDAPMASPPHGFGAHDGAAPGVTEFPQFGESASEGVAHCVVSVMVKALVRPKGVDCRRHPAAAAAQPAECGYVGVADLESGKRFWKDIAIVLRVRARARYRADIRNNPNLRQLQQFDEAFE